MYNGYNDIAKPGLGLGTALILNGLLALGEAGFVDSKWVVA
jgi:hypothetical protein